MRNPASLTLLLLAVSLAPAARACEYPPDLKLPDGKSATYSTSRSTSNLWLMEGLNGVTRR